MSVPQASGLSFSGPEWFSYNRERHDAIDAASQTNAWSAEAAAKQMDFQERMSNTSWQRGTADMQAAGINPMLAVSQGGASSPQGAGFAGAKGTVAKATQLSGSVQMQTAAQVDNLNAQSEKARAEAKEIAERTPSHAVDREYTAHRSAEIRQAIAESSMRIEKIIAETDTQKATASHINQQIINLKEAVPQLQETVRLLRAQGSEINQRVRQNLPKLEAGLRQLETIYKAMEMPGRETTHAFESSATGSVLRTIKEALKDMIPGFGVLMPLPGRTNTTIHRRAKD